MTPKLRKKQTIAESVARLSKTTKGDGFITGRLLPWHRVVLHAIWARQPCVPSVNSRRAWAAARKITPIHVHNWFSAKKARTKKKKESIDIENEGYELDAAEGAMEEVVKREIKEEEVAVFLVQRSMDVQAQGGGFDVVRNPLTPCQQNGGDSKCSIPTSTPDFNSSNVTLFFPLSPTQASSPLFGKSFYSPPALVPSLSSPFSAYISNHSPNFVPYSTESLKRKYTDAYNEPAWLRRKKLRLLDPPSSPSPNPRATRIPSSDISIETADPTSKRIKQEIIDNDNILKLVSSSPSAFALSSPFPASSPVPSSPTAFADRASTPERVHDNRDTAVTPSYTDRYTYGKDDFCCFCGIDDINEVFLAGNRREGIWITKESKPSTQDESLRIDPFLSKLRPPHAYAGTYDTVSWESELYESIEWMEGGFDNFELSAIPWMAMVGRSA